MRFLVTTPSSFEKEAIAELKGVLEEVKIKTTYFKGVLLAETPLTRGCFKNHINKKFPHLTAAIVSM